MNSRTPLYFSKYASMNILASLVSMPSCCERPKGDSPYTMPNVDCLGAAAMFGVELIARDPEDLRCRERVDVLPGAVGLDQKLVFGEVR